jgi:hypothetical protein
VDFFADFPWLFLVFDALFEALLEALEELCAGALDCPAALCAAKVKGTTAAVKASARIVFFIVFLSRRAVSTARSQFHLARDGRITR